MTRWRWIPLLLVACSAQDTDVGRASTEAGEPEPQPPPPGLPLNEPLQTASLLASQVPRPPAPALPDPEALPLGAAGSPPLTRLRVPLGPAMPTGPQQLQTIQRLVYPLRIPAGPWQGGEALAFSHLNGRAVVHVDGIPIASVLGGPAPVEVDLGGRLPPGPHELMVELAPEPAAGPLLLGGDRLSTPLLIDSPILLLRPRSHVVSVAGPLVGGLLQPMARVRDAPPGARVRFVATLDGELLAELGVAPVEDGSAILAPVPWRGGTWKVGDPTLIDLFAILEDGQGGVFDAMQILVGPREVRTTETGFEIGGESVRLVGWRIMPQVDVLDVLLLVDRSGVNTIEYHGGPLTAQQLTAFDELGLAVAATPRCEGTFQDIPAAQRLAIVEQHAAIIADQSQRSAWNMAGHPSLVLWVPESKTLSGLWVPLDQLDPENRPVVNVDLPPSVVSPGLLGRESELPKSWIIETAWEGPVGPIATAVEGFALGLELGARGGIVENSGEPERQAAWKPMLQEHGITPVAIVGRRSRSRVQVDPLPAGEIAWLDGPWLSADAAYGGPHERGEILAWYAGEAMLAAGAEVRAVRLEPRQWTLKGPIGPEPVLPAPP